MKMKTKIEVGNENIPEYFERCPGFSIMISSSSKEKAEFLFY